MSLESLVEPSAQRSRPRTHLLRMARPTLAIILATALHLVETAEHAVGAGLRDVVSGRERQRCVRSARVLLTRLLAAADCSPLLLLADGLLGLFPDPVSANFRPVGLPGSCTILPLWLSPRLSSHG